MPEKGRTDEIAKQGILAADVEWRAGIDGKPIPAPENTEVPDA